MKLTPALLATLVLSTSSLVYPLHDADAAGWRSSSRSSSSSWSHSSSSSWSRPSSSRFSAPRSTGSFLGQQRVQSSNFSGMGRKAALMSGVSTSALAAGSASASAPSSLRGSQSTVGTSGSLANQMALTSSGKVLQNAQARAASAGTTGTSSLSGSSLGTARTATASNGFSSGGGGFIGSAPSQPQVVVRHTIIHHGYGYYHYHPYVYGSSDPLMTGLLMGAILNDMADDRAAAYAYSQMNNPNYIAWHQQMVNQAVNDAQVRQHLADLDAQVAQIQSQQGAPQAASPQDLSSQNAPAAQVDSTPAPIAETVVAQPRRPVGEDSHSHWGVILFLLLIGLVLVGFLVWKIVSRAKAEREDMERDGRLADISGGSSSSETPTYSPLRIGVGSVVKLPLVVEALAAQDGANFPAPAELQNKICAMGTMTLGGMKGWNFYFNGRQSYLRVMESGETTLFSTVLMKSLDDEGIEYLMNDTDGAIGLSEFTDDSGHRYLRSWSPSPVGVVNRIPPVEFQENVITDAVGSSTTMRRAIMDYSRSVGAFEEVLTLSISEEMRAEDSPAAFIVDVGLKLVNADQDPSTVIETA